MPSFPQMVCLFAASQVASGKMLKAHDGGLEFDVDPGNDDLKKEKLLAAEGAEARKNQKHESELRAAQANEQAVSAAARLKAAEEMVRAASEAAAQAKAAEEEAARISAENAKAAELARQEAIARMQKEEESLRKQEADAVKADNLASDESAEAKNAAAQANMRKAAAGQMLSAAEKKAAEMEKAALEAEEAATKATQLAAELTEVYEKAQERRNTVIMENKAHAITVTEAEGENGASEKKAGEGAAKDANKEANAHNATVGVNTAAATNATNATNSSIKVSAAETKKDANSKQIEKATSFMLKSSSKSSGILDDLDEEKHQAWKESSGQTSESQAADERKAKSEKAHQEAEKKKTAAEQLLKSASEVAAETRATELQAVKAAIQAQAAAAKAKAEAELSQSKEMQELTAAEAAAKKKMEDAEEEKTQRLEEAKQANMRKAASLQMKQAASDKLKLATEEAEKAVVAAAKANQKRAAAQVVSAQAKERFATAVSENQNMATHVNSEYKDGETKEWITNVNAFSAKAGQALPDLLPPKPTEHGCYQFLKTKTPKIICPIDTEWKRDQYGEEKQGASTSEAKCQARGPLIDKHCGTSVGETKMLFVEVAAEASSDESKESKEEDTAATGVAESAAATQADSNEPAEVTKETTAETDGNAIAERVLGLWGGYAGTKGQTLAKVIDGSAKKSVQVLALQNSGADLLTQLMRLNFGNAVNYYGAAPTDDTLNNRHGISKNANLNQLHEHDPNMLAALEKDEVFVVMLVRNPLAWLHALHVNPADLENCTAREEWLSEECEVNAPGGKDSTGPAVTYKKIGGIWNNWVESYRMASEFGLTRRLTLTYENLLGYPLRALLEISSFMGLDMPDKPSILPSGMADERKAATDFVNDKLYLKKFTKDEMAQACGMFDVNLQKSLGYKDCTSD